MDTLRASRAPTRRGYALPGRCVGLLGLAALLATPLLGCALDPPAPLAPGDCREDTDCPGTLRCLQQGPAGSLGHCGCQSDLHCASWSQCDPQGHCRAHLLRCDLTTGTCRCATGRLCPGTLRCTADERCVCAGAEDCPLTGCTCQGERCVRARGDDLLLCEQAPQASAPPLPDAGPGDAGAGGEQ